MTTTATQTFTYADDGRLRKSVAADGTVTHWFHYPATGGSASSAKALFDKTWQAEAPTLSAPAVEDGMKRLLMLEFQYQLFESVRLPLNLTLYGYPDKPLASMANTPNQLLTLEGVDITNLEDAIKDEAVALQFNLVTGQGKALIRYQITNELEAEAGSVGVTKSQVTEFRYWGAEKTQLWTTETREWDAGKGLNITLASRITDKEEADVTLSRELLSPFSGRLLRNFQDHQQHRFGYDGLGRMVSDTAYADDDGLNDQSPRTDKQLSAISIQYEDTQGGTQVTTVDLAQPEARRQRTLYDGLQRPVQRQLQRVPGDDVSAANFCVTQDQDYALDYLPGGLQRRLDPFVTPSEERDWFWIGTTEQSETVPTDAVSKLSTGEELFSARGVRLLREQVQTQLKSGAVKLSSVERLPPSVGDVKGKVRLTTDKSFDWQGRLIEVKQTSDSPVKTERVFKIGYDDLGRPTQWTAPDGTVVKRSYSGLSDKVTRLAILEKKADAKEVVLASQEVGVSARITKRVIGKRSYQFDYTTDGHPSGVRMPDTARLMSEESSDGNHVTYKVRGQDDSSDKRAKTVAVFAYDPLRQAIRASRPASEAEEQPATKVSGSAPRLLGSSQYRRVTSDLVFNVFLQRSLRGDDYGTEYGSGSKVIAYCDHLNRRTRVRRGDLEYYYRYNAYGAREGETVRDLKTGHTLVAEYEFDAFGQEIRRRYVLNDKEVEVYEMTWSGSGQLLDKSLKRDGVLCRNEHFSYDTRGRLNKWTVDKDASDAPGDSSGKAICEQSYGYDFLNNLTLCTTTYADNSSCKQTYSYDPDNLTRRIKVVTVDTPAPDTAGKTGNSSSKAAELNYDANGNLTLDDQGRVLLYTLSGQLRSVTAKKGGALISRYEYDESGRLVAQWDEAAQQRSVLIYSEDRLCGEVLLDKTKKELKRWRLDEEAGLAVQCITSAGQQTVFTLADPVSGAGSEYSADAAGTLQRSSVCFTPWGECRAGAYDALSSRLGFNGLRRDPLLGFYHLGNGYRAYNPSLRVFQQPDSWSPLGAGGLNDYAYCSGDPVNLSDPDGHLMISRWGEAQLMTRLDQLIQDMTPQKPPQQEADNRGSLLSTIIWSAVGILTAVAAVLLAIPTGGLSLVAAGVLLAVTLVSSGLSIASVALQNSNPELAEKLGAAGMGIDLASMIIPVKAVLGAGGRMMRWAGSKVGRAAQRVGNQLQLYGRKFTDQISQFGRRTNESLGRQVGHLTGLKVYKIQRFNGRLGISMTGGANEAGKKYASISGLWSRPQSATTPMPPTSATQASASGAAATPPQGIFDRVKESIEIGRNSLMPNPQASLEMGMNSEVRQGLAAGIDALPEQTLFTRTLGGVNKNLDTWADPNLTLLQKDRYVERAAKTIGPEAISNTTAFVESSIDWAKKGGPSGWTGSLFNAAGALAAGAMEADAMKMGKFKP
jgi:RHS repeat-associated protein